MIRPGRKTIGSFGAILGLVPLLGLVARPAAAQPVIGPYVSLGAGADFLQNQKFRPRFPGFGPSPRSYRFDVGPAGNVAIGFGLPTGTRLELEGDYSYNHVRGVTSAQPLRAGGYEQQYGGFFNVVQAVPVVGPLGITPYLGAGIGYREIELDNVNSGPPTQIGTNGLYQRRGRAAYQGIAGIAAPLPFLPDLALTAEYRLIGLINSPTYPRDFAAAQGPFPVGVHNVFNHEALIGLRLALFQPPPPPSPSPPAEITPPSSPQARTFLVFFDWDRAELTSRARQIINEAAQASTHVQTTRIEVNGYTDLSGTARYNQALSVRRADMVKAELIRDGVAAGEIAIQGFGEAHPLVPTAQGVREPQNRRVEIILK